MTDAPFNRRRFLQTTMVAGAAAALPLDAIAAATLPPTLPATRRVAKYTRYNVMSAGGQKALASYARGVEAMIKLPAADPRNWFRNAFIHFMDCPHGNWWFYVWHRGYLGYFEQTIRTLSKDPTFAIPYWDWTQLPQIPDGMFDGALSPTNVLYEPYTKNLANFQATIEPALQAYWNSLNAAQMAQLKARGYVQFGDMWNDVTGYSPSLGHGLTDNMAFANTCGSRYLSRENPKLDPATAYDVSAFVVASGLLAPEFYSTQKYLSFTSSKTPSHNTAPSGSTVFSVLEGMPHNKTHNYIGGYGPMDPGPYGSMTNNLSPFDPIFFLHHSNMDRLWDVWTRKQQALKMPYLPTGADLATLSNEPFLFYANSTGQYVGAAKAGDYLDVARFDYQYEPGFGEDLVQAPKVVASAQTPVMQGTVKGNEAAVSVPTQALKSHLASANGSPLVASVTIAHPTTEAPAREFEVHIGATSNSTAVGPESPTFAGTIAFFGTTPAMKGMANDVTFLVPLPKKPQAFGTLGAAPTTAVDIRVVPAHRGAKQPVVKSISVNSR